MKKMSKVLAILLSVVVFASAFAIAPSAISASSSAKEMLNYYENSIISTSAKEDVIKSKNHFEMSYVPDFSGLTTADKIATIEADGWEGFEDGYEDVYDEDLYFYGDAYKDYYYEGRSQFIDFFSIKRDIRNYDLTYKSAKLSTSKNGDVTITLVYTENFDGDINTLTYTAKIAKSGYIKSYSLKQYAEYTYISAFGDTYTVTDTLVDEYVFEYKKVDVKGIELSANYVELGKDEVVYITPEILPENATFKGVYAGSNDYEVADCWVEEDGSISIWATGRGSTTIEVYTYDGEFIAECEVVVNYSFWDMIVEFFENLFSFFFYGPDDYYGDEIYIEDEYYEYY